MAEEKVLIKGLDKLADGDPRKQTIRGAEAK